MNEEIDWTKITGSSFESLIATLLRFEFETGITHFDRDGKDQGIDILQEKDNEKIVYQCKYHQDCKLKVLDIEKEKEKIIKNLNNKSKAWEGVKKWVFVGNFELNSNDKVKLDEKLKEIKNECGLETSYWSKSDIEKKLKIEYPVIRNEYFGDKSNNLYKIDQFKKIHFDRSFLEKKEHQGIFVGRKDKLEKVRKFLKSKDESILLVYGEEGIGKTRFLIEIFQSLYKNFKNLKFYYSFGNEVVDVGKYLKYQENTLIIIDDLSGENFFKLETYLTKIGFLKGKNNKIIISSGKDYFNKSKNISTTIELKGLEVKDVEFLCNKLGVSTIYSIDIKRQVKGNPSWIFLSIYGGKDKLQENIKVFIKENYKNIDNNLLYWISLFGEINVIEDEKKNVTEDEKKLDFLALKLEIDKDELSDLLEENKKSFYCYGYKKRIYKIKNEIIRKYFIKKFLFRQDEESLTSRGEKFVKNEMFDDLFAPSIRLIIHLLKEKNKSLFEEIFPQEDEGIESYFKKILFIGFYKVDDTLKTLKNILEKKCKSYVYDNKYHSILWEEYDKYNEKDQVLKKVENILKSLVYQLYLYRKDSKDLEDYLIKVILFFIQFYQNYYSENTEKTALRDIFMDFELEGIFLLSEDIANEIKNDEEKLLIFLDTLNFSHKTHTSSYGRTGYFYTRKLTKEEQKCKKRYFKFLETIFVIKIKKKID